MNPSYSWQTWNLTVNLRNFSGIINHSVLHSNSMSSLCTMEHFLPAEAKRFSITVVIDAGRKRCYDIVNSHHGVIKYSLAVGAEACSTGMLLTVFRASCVSLFIGRSCSTNCPNTINDFLCTKRFIFIACNSHHECKKNTQISILTHPNRCWL